MPLLQHTPTSTVSSVRRALLALAGSVCLSLSAQADTFPSKAITIVVPFPAGGPTDANARLIGKELSQVLGQPVVIDNRAGAGGTVGSTWVARAPADGYTLLWGGTSSLVVAPALYPNLNYDPIKSFQPIGMVVRGPMMLAGRAGLPAKTLPELLAYAKANRLTYATAGTGSIGHLAGELFQEMTGVPLIHVPYRGGAPALNDLLGGQVDLIFETAQFMTPQIKAGKVNTYAVAGNKRYPGLPEIPTMSELMGKASWEAYSWFGLVAPANTPAAVTAALEKALLKVVTEPNTRAQIVAGGLEPVNSSAEFLAQAIEQDLTKWRTIVTRRNIKPE